MAKTMVVTEQQIKNAVAIIMCQWKPHGARVGLVLKRGRKFARVLWNDLKRQTVKTKDLEAWGAKELAGLEGARDRFLMRAHAAGFDLKTYTRTDIENDLKKKADREKMAKVRAARDANKRIADGMRDHFGLAYADENPENHDAKQLTLI